jgi:hypothetical protein
MIQITGCAERVFKSISTADFAGLPAWQVTEQNKIPNTPLLLSVSFSPLAISEFEHF